jgi:hypothetical protein
MTFDNSMDDTMDDPTGSAERGELAGAAPEEDAGVDPRRASLDAYNEAIAQDLPSEDAAAASLRVLVAAANAGDKRVVFDAEARREEAWNRMAR